MKKIIMILSGIFLILLILIVCMNIDTTVTEQNSYIQLDQVDITEKEKAKITQKIDLIDNILLTEYDSEKGIDSQFIMDVCIKYVLNNYEYFENNIIYLDNEFVYEEDDTKYTTNNYMDKIDIYDIASMLFDKELTDITKTVYFDDNNKLVALISKGSDEIVYADKEISKLEKIENNKYEVEVKYIIDEEENIYFKIRYDMIKKNEEVVIIDINVIK